MSRLSDVLDYILASENCDEATAKILKGVMYLDEDVNYMDYNDYESLFAEPDDLIEMVDDCLGIDISDTFEEDYI